MLQFSVELLLEFFNQGWVDERVKIFSEKCQMHAVEGFVTIEVNFHIDGYWAVHTGHALCKLITISTSVSDLDVIIIRCTHACSLHLKCRSSLVLKQALASACNLH